MRSREDKNGRIWYECVVFEGKMKQIKNDTKPESCWWVPQGNLLRFKYEALWLSNDFGVKPHIKKLSL